MVSGDTGPTHIGAAVGTPIVGIYGPTRPERNGPWLPEDVTVSRAARLPVPSLAPMPRDRMCLLDIEVPEVLGAVERRLAAGRRREPDDRELESAGHAIRAAPASPKRWREGALARRSACAKASAARLCLRGAGAVAGAADPRASRGRARAVAALGEALRIWAAGHLNKSREVTSSGPYRGSRIRSTSGRR